MYAYYNQNDYNALVGDADYRLQATVFGIRYVLYGVSFDLITCSKL